MYGRTNAGGGVKAFAFIFATYPVGSTCTATDGSRTLKLKDTSGYGVFYPPYAGTWTVTATDGDQTTCKTVEITFEGQDVSVELSYAQWLYKDGNQYTDITGGWGANNFRDTTVDFGEVITSDCTLQGTKTRWTHVVTQKKIDITKYNTLYADVEITQRPKTFSDWGIGAVAAQGSDDYAAVFMDGCENGTDIIGIVTVDISALNGEYFIQSGTSNTYMVIKTIWLE